MLLVGVLPAFAEAAGPSKECNDGVDNDGDGHVDHPADPGCSSKKDASELGTVQCDDGADNDGDGRTDAQDNGCSGPADAAETREYADYRALPGQVARLEMQAYATSPNAHTTDDPEMLFGARVRALGDRAYVTTATGPDAVVVYDISNPYEPEHIGSVSFGTTQEFNAYEGLEVIGFLDDRVVVGAVVGLGRERINNLQRNYVQNSGGWPAFYDLTDPSTPVLVAEFRDLVVHAFGVHQESKTAYLFPQYTSEIHVVDASDPDDIRVVARIPILPPAAHPHGCKAVTLDEANDRMFCTAGSGFLGTPHTTVWDISNPRAPVLAATIRQASLEGIHCCDQAYAIPILGGAYVAVTAAAGDCAAPPEGMDMPTGRVWFYDMAFIPPRYTGSIGLPYIEGVPCERWGADKGSELGAGTGLLAMAWQDAGLVLVDASDPADPKLLSIDSSDGQARDAFYHRGLVFVGGANHVLKVAVPIEGAPQPLAEPCPDDEILQTVCV